MKKSTKKNLIEYSIIFGIIGTLYITGLHTEVLGFVQRGVLVTGLMDPDTEKEFAENESYPQADFSMKLISSNGEKLDMESLRGKVIFLNIWASWCPPCLAEMPGINKLYKDVDKDKVAFIMLSVDDDFTRAMKFHQKKNFDFEIYQAPKGLPSMYYSQSIPTTYVIDAKGNLALTHSGMGDFNTSDFKAYLKELE
ncbi:TlpA family protein disulfide reductase [Marivirga sp. S37H4]|uniref:TlpA family protein disulfide reductase n=1 Tax=Marivirga aurantiaca TaxID=2802615 RepID=A0A934WV76_9BACT|nr:TlpA disulfide reductase family protein [Marivirga aurantiaca]MBK6263542.1 TlpA family protein disulfide reductase [Marivirga aurantiaca]